MLQPQKSLHSNDTNLLPVALLNAFVSLLGYYAAAALVDRPKIGRLKLQQYGFLLTGTLFCLCGYLRENISTVWLVIMYLGSSFFGQVSPSFLCLFTTT